MDLEKISPNSLVGKILRLPLKLIPPNLPIPIFWGPLQGKRWIKKAGRNGCWLGTYEEENQRIFQKLLKHGNIVFDIGAHAGFFTLLSAVLVGKKGRVFAFEPLPRNIKFLHQHLKLNRIKNVTIIEAAVSNREGTTTFPDSETGYQGSLSKGGNRGNLSVKLVKLDDLIQKGEVPIPNYIKIDVEGHEKFVLTGAKSLFAKYHPILLLSIHGRTVYQQCTTILQGWGYKIEVLAEEINGQLPKNLDILATYSESNNSTDDSTD